MNIELYIFYSLIGFSFFIVALLYSKGLYSIFIWPIAFLCFALLIFSKPEVPGLVWFNIGITFYIAILLLWDMWDKFVINMGE
jgi:hypothetical protein